MRRSSSEQQETENIIRNISHNAGRTMKSLGPNNAVSPLGWPEHLARVAPIPKTVQF